MADLPDGVDYNTAMAAIAWEITKATKLKWAIDEEELSDYLRNVTNDYLKVKKALTENKPIEKST